MRPWIEKLVTTWGIAWVSLLLGRAIWRLAPYAVEVWTEDLMTTGQQGIFIGWLLANAYLEGYRGIPTAIFSPCGFKGGVPGAESAAPVGHPRASVLASVFFTRPAGRKS